MVGLSLSLCIKDIMAGKVLESDVTKIITGTSARTEADWDRLCADYRRVYWRPFEGNAVVALVRRLRAQGKIVQPRLDNPDHWHSLSAGVWVDDELTEGN